MIPKVIHYCWVGGNPKPDLVKKCIRSWKKYCPDYEIIEWNEDNYDFSKNDYMRQAYESQKWGFVPDYARLDIVYQYGGIYLDTDVEIIRNLDPLLFNSGYVGIETAIGEKCHVALGLGFGAEAGNATIKKIRDDYEGRLFVKQDGDLDLTPSPHFTTAVLDAFGFSRENTLQRIEGLTVYPSEYFCPRDWKTGILHKTRNTYSIHQFMASWFDEEQTRVYSIQKNKYKIDYYKHTPNRILRKILGDRFYEAAKALIRN